MVVAVHVGIDAESLTGAHLASFCTEFASARYNGAVDLNRCSLLRADDLHCLGKCSAIQELSLRDCGMGWSLASAISRVLLHAGLPSLSTLDISGNNIRDGGADIVSIMLQRTRSISHLDMSNNKISSVGAVSIGRAVGTGMGLVRLLLSHNRIGECIREGFSEESAKMWHWKSDSRGAMALATAIGESRTLMLLDVASNALGLHKHSLQIACRRTAPLRDAVLVS
jgi:hypothetical protein